MGWLSVTCCLCRKGEGELALDLGGGGGGITRGVEGSSNWAAENTVMLSRVCSCCHMVVSLQKSTFVNLRRYQTVQQNGQQNTG